VKIRFRGDSVRVRLTRREVEALAGGAEVESATRFGASSSLRYRISSGGDRLCASFETPVVEIRVPAQLLQSWVSGDQIAISAEQSFESGSLKIAVEKDLECANPRPGEDNSDAFPASLGKVHCR